MNLSKTKEGTLLYHHLHGVVKLVKFDYGYCCVEKLESLDSEIIMVLSSKIEKYNKKEHGEWEIKMK